MRRLEIRAEKERQRERETNRSAAATLEEISSEQANCRDETTTSRLLPSISTLG